MTLDEAINHAEEVSKEQRELYRLCPIPSDMCDPNKDCASLKNGKNRGCIKCAKEHEQLAEWLKQLKAIKQIIVQHDSDCMPEDYWYIDKIREVVHEVEE